jgi:hypothetical protein
MALQKVLGVIYADRGIGFNGVYDGYAAGTGEMRQPVPQTIGGVGNAITDKYFVQHITFRCVFDVSSLTV